MRIRVIVCGLYSADPISRNIHTDLQWEKCFGLLWRLSLCIHVKDLLQFCTWISLKYWSDPTSDNGVNHTLAFEKSMFNVVTTAGDSSSAWSSYLIGSSSLLHVTKTCFKA